MNPRRQAINCFLISTEEYLFFIFSPNMHGYACRFPSGTSVFIYKRIPPLPSNHLCAWKCIVDFNPASMLQIQFTPNTCIQLKKWSSEICFLKIIMFCILETKCFKLTCLSEYFLLKMTNILDFQLNECLQIFNIKAMFHN